MKKKVYETPIVFCIVLGEADLLTVSADIPDSWFKDYDDDWENNF